MQTRRYLLLRGKLIVFRDFATVFMFCYREPALLPQAGAAIINSLPSRSALLPQAGRGCYK